ncbi:hypothetical protein RSAG8_07357, partial [Rhizoctonia solani AG-8 WAC10335]
MKLWPPLPTRLLLTYQTHERDGMDRTQQSFRLSKIGDGRILYMRMEYGKLVCFSRIGRFSFICPEKWTAGMTVSVCIPNIISCPLTEIRPTRVSSRRTGMLHGNLRSASTFSLNWFYVRQYVREARIEGARRSRLELGKHTHAILNLFPIIAHPALIPSALLLHL